MMLSETLTFLYPGIDFRRDVILRDDGDGPYIAQWNLPVPRPEPEELAAAERQGAAMAIHGAIKAEARRRILAVMPEWKQANATARMLEKLSLGETADAEWQQGQAAWGWIKEVRAHSDALEAQVSAAEDPRSVDITVGWPE